MHPDFADWYRRVEIDPKSDDLQKRWQGIEAFHLKATRSDLTNVTRVFFGLTPRDENFLAKYRAEFKATDDVFPMRYNGAELQVLAGATLARNFGGGEEWAAAAALALACGASGGARKAPVPEIVDLARKALREQSTGLRAAKNQPPLPPAFDLGEEFQNLKTTLSGVGGNFQTLHGPLLDVLQPMLKAMTGISNWVRRAAQMEELRQEESDILWWLFGERSRDLDVPFSELKVPSGCIIGAKELADLTRMLPGPFGVEAYLHKMLGLAHPDLEGTVTLSDAIAACPLAWQGQFIAHAGIDAVADLCPVHLAAQKSVEAGGKKTVWPGPFQTVSGLKATIKMKPVDLALQVYRERLFVVALNGLQEAADE